MRFLAKSNRSKKMTYRSVQANFKTFICFFLSSLKT